EVEPGFLLQFHPQHVRRHLCHRSQCGWRQHAHARLWHAWNGNARRRHAWSRHGSAWCSRAPTRQLIDTEVWPVARSRGSRIEDRGSKFEISTVLDSRSSILNPLTVPGTDRGRLSTSSWLFPTLAELFPLGRSGTRFRRSCRKVRGGASRQCRARLCPCIPCTRPARLRNPWEKSPSCPEG